MINRNGRFRVKGGFAYVAKLNVIPYMVSSSFGQLIRAYDLLKPVLPRLVRGLTGWSRIRLSGTPMNRSAKSAAVAALFNTRQPATRGFFFPLRTVLKLYNSGTSRVNGVKLLHHNNLEVL